MGRMASGELATIEPKNKTKKVKGPGGAKKESTHPPYLDMVVEVIRSATDDKRKGLSKVILLKRIRENYNFGDTDAKSINTQVSLALKRGLAKEVLKKAKEEGSARRLSIGTPAKKVVSKVKKSEGSAKKAPAKKAPAKAKGAKEVKGSGKKTPVKPKKAAEVKAKKVSKKTTADAGSAKKKRTKK